MKTCIAAIILVLCFPGALVRAQPGMDVSPAIPVHPDVTTILQLPEQIEDSRIHYGDEFRVQGVGSAIYVRPRPGTPAGMEAFLEVKTRTLHQMFRLRVVERAGDATPRIVVPAVTAAACVEAAGDDATSAAPAPAQPAAGSTGTSSLASPQPTEQAPAAAAQAQRAAAADDEHAVAAAGSPRFHLSVHAVMAVAGVTALDVPGYVPDEGRQPLRAFGLRAGVAPRGAWWSVEAGINAEWLEAPTVHVQDLGEELGRREREVSGPWLRADMGMRARFGTRWMPSLYAGLGLQAHLSKTGETLIEKESRMPQLSTEGMRYSAVLALGMGVQYQARDVLLGLDLQMRQGVPADYRSVAAFFSVGFFLDQGE